MKFCKDCKYAVGEEMERMTCSHPRNTVEYVRNERYLVSGIEQPKQTAIRAERCLAQRETRPPDIDALVCGAAGKWFERK